MDLASVAPPLGELADIQFEASVVVMMRSLVAHH